MASIGEVVAGAIPGGVVPNGQAIERPCRGGCGDLILALGPSWCAPCLARENTADLAKQTAIDLGPARDSVPNEWRWARLGSPLLSQRVAGSHETIAIVQRRAPWPDGVTVHGPAGLGKTSLAVACFHAWIEDHFENTIDLRKTARFVSARMLPLAKIEHGQGRGGDYLLALSAACIVLDDLGSEGDMPNARAAVTDVLAERHAWSRPTIVTTYLDEAGVLARYGDGITRRLFERACTVELRA